MTEIHSPITAQTPTTYAVDICVGRMLRYITRKDAESLLPLDEANDDLIQQSIRMLLNDCRKFLAHWVGHGGSHGRYEITGRTLISRDGIEWIDARTSEPVDTEDFHSASITLMGGPRNGEVIR